MNLRQVRAWYSGQFPNLKEIDPLIRPLLALLNDLPGCATICSCAGAGLVGNTKKRHFKYDLPYLYMVCRNIHSMTLLLMAYHKSGGFVVGYHTPEAKKKHAGMGFEVDANEPTITFHFRSYKQLKKFERSLQSLLMAFVSDEDVSVERVL